MTTELEALRKEVATLRDLVARLDKQVELLNKELRILLTARPRKDEGEGKGAQGDGYG